MLDNASAPAARQQALPEILVEGPRTFVFFMDRIFGTYCMAMIALAGVMWMRGEAGPLTVALLVGFCIVNLAITTISLRWAKPRPAEWARVAAGSVIAPAMYILAEGPLRMWWPGFLMMCLGSTMILGLVTGSRRLGHALVAYYFVLQLLAELATGAAQDWYRFAINAGATAMICWLLAEVMAVLARALAAEHEQRRQLAEEKARSESLLQKEAEAALRASEAHFRSLIEQSSDFISIVDRSGRFVYLSPAVQRILGYPPEGWMGRSLPEFVHPDDQALIHERFAALIGGALDLTTFECRVRHADGSWRVIENVSRRLDDGTIVGNARDITERKHAEQTLQAMVEGTAAVTGADFFRSLTGQLARALGVRYAFITECLDEEATRVNMLALWQNGQEQDGGEYAVEGTPCKLVVHGDQAFYPRGVAEMFPQDNWLDSIDAQGYLGVPMIGRDGSVLGHIVVIHDQPLPPEIADNPVLKIFAARAAAELERKVAEDALRHNEELFRSLIENSSDGTVIISSEGLLRYVSPAMVRMIGYGEQELLGRPFTELIHPEDVQPALDYIAGLPDIHGQTSAFSARIRHRDGSYRVVENVSHRLPDGDVVGNNRDVTDRRRAEDALRLAERRFRTVFEQPLLSVQICAPDGTVQSWNEASSLMWAEKADDGFQLQSLLDNPYLVEHGVMPKIRKAFAGEPTFIPATRYPFGDEGSRWVQSFLYPVKDGDGTVREVVALHEDITAQKDAEEQLRQLNLDLERRVSERTAALETALAEQRRLTDIIETTSDFVGLATVDQQVTYINKAGRRMVGMGDDESLEGVSFADLFRAETYSTVLEVGIPTALREGTWTTEIALAHRDGHDIPVSLVGTVLYGPDGAPHSFAGTMRDITERKRFIYELKRAKEDAVAALAESRRLADVLEATTDIVAFITLDGELLYLNESGRRLLEVSPEVDVKTLRFTDLFSPDVLEHFQTVGIPTALREGTWSAEFPMRTYAGADMAVSLVGIVHRDADGTPTHLSGIMRDITERKRFIYELKRAKEDAVAASAAKSIFLATMSHEIRTPLNGIIGMTELLLDSPLSAQQHDLADTIRSSGDTLLTIINDILDFSKIEAGRLELEEQPFDVRECIEAALDVLARPAAQKGLDLGVLIEANTPTAIIGDEVRLRQILVNLLSNAVKFTARGEVVVTVSLAPREDGTQEVEPPLHRLQFAVSDTGIGIAEHQRDRLFQSFSQIDASTTRKYGGTGLGLAISKRMSELMGGTMWVESQLDHGSTFFFTIQAQAAPEADSIYKSRSQPQLQNKRVLVVDDSPTSRATIVTQAGTWGMECFEAGSGAEALAMIAAGERFDLAILDLHMPEMDGLTLAALLREHHPAAALPLVMITGLHIQEEDPRLAEFAGFLSKPVKASQLYNTLLAIFAQRGQAFYLAEHEHNEFDGGLGQRQPLSILLVEDNLINQKVALLTLERLGYQAAVANNGAEAVAAVQREPFGVVLMDMHMPEMDGLEATRRIRRLPALAAGRQPYIIALTANAIQGDRELCLQAGMDDYISKPLQVAALRAALERAHQRAAGAAPLEATGSPTPPPAIDAAALDDLGDAAPELIGLFLDEAPALLATIRDAIARAQPDRVREAAHNLKGSSQYLGAGAVAAHSQRLELLGRSGSLDGADVALIDLERALSAAEQALTRSPEDGE